MKLILTISSVLIIISHNLYAGTDDSLVKMNEIIFRNEFEKNAAVKFDILNFIYFHYFTIIDFF